ncbi:hypothetical protein [Singulisphaera acidiphila]|uniref:Uncharacterized protein n=1 Tax=Singulisphaera acidiphila (strain ATCC BAA-1392 / DSM 18658 / VKM B-2454 / MOB10) TaxID=886293 RepID=L0DC49_SINAD|nr:hypothetical protein [Singulisphaera acidiphila]AGA26398.1 hypothetical protein Sinac_2061 [Singulisphaera acidiphila DSM 18658]
MSRQPTDDEIISEVGPLIEAGDIKALYLVASKKIQEILKRLTDRICEGVDGTKADASLVIRTIARKSEEALTSVIYCVEGGHNYAATGLLRPICEELIFAKFLRSLHRADADEYVKLRSILDIHEGISAQGRFFSE